MACPPVHGSNQRSSFYKGKAFNKDKFPFKGRKGQGIQTKGLGQGSLDGYCINNGLKQIICLGTQKAFKMEPLWIRNACGNAAHV